MGQCASHLSGRDDCLVTVAPLLSMAGDWQTLLDGARAESRLRSCGSMPALGGLWATKDSWIDGKNLRAGF